MRKMIFVILFALGFVSQAVADGSNHKLGCDEKCRAYKSAQSTGPIPYRYKTVCIYFKQTQVDNVVIRFFDGAGNELDAGDRLHNRKNAGIEDKICPGSHWFVKALESGGYVQLCNSETGRLLEQTHIDIMLKYGRTPPGKWFHLQKSQT